MDENSVQSLGFINRLKNRLSQTDQRTAFDAFIVVLILVGLAASVFLAGQRQIFRSRAAQEGNAVVLDKDGNPPPKDEQGNPVVETQQIRIKIEFPTEWNSQGLLPSSLFSPAYAQNKPSCNEPYYGRSTVCADSEGNMINNLGKTCGIYVGSIFDEKICEAYNPNYKYCWTEQPCPTATQPTQTPTPTQPTETGASTPTIATIVLNASSISIRGANFGSYLDGVVWYSPGGEQQNPLSSSDVVWSSSAIRIDNASNIKGGYVKVCRSDGKCSQFAQIPDRPATTAQPTATPAQAQGCGARWEGKKTTCSADANLDKAECTYLEAWSHPKSPVCGATTPFCWACPESAIGAPAQPTATPTPTQPPGEAQPPTATPVPEQTEWIRISLNENNVKSGNCFREPGGPGTGSSNPREHCMEFSITDPYFTQRGNMVDLWLPSKPETYTIYIGFVSDKGNLKPNPLQVKVTYRPKAPLVVKTTPPQPTGTGQECISDVDPNGVARFCVNRENRDKLKNVCSGGELKVGYNCPSNFPYCLIGTNIICSPQSTQPTTQPTVQLTPQAATTCDKLFDDCMRDYETPGIKKCNLMKTQCELLKTGGTPPAPIPTPTGPSEKNSAFCANVRSACLGNASSGSNTYTRCTDAIYKGCIQRGYKNLNDHLNKALQFECQQQQYECQSVPFWGGINSWRGTCDTNFNQCQDRIRALWQQ